jgi:hypothetical protein
MKKFSLRSLAAICIAALLLAILSLPIGAGATSAGASTSKSGTAITALKGEPFAAYTKKKAKKKARKVHRHKRIHRHKKVAKKKAVAKAVAPLAIVAIPVAPPVAVVNEPALAETILAGLKARYPRYLGNATVEFGDAMGYQAISYYTTGRIVISPTHTASVQRIVEHEIWHVIDWQDNNTIDWGEAIPPANYAAFAN